MLVFAFNTYMIDVFLWYAFMNDFIQNHNACMWYMDVLEVLLWNLKKRYLKKIWPSINIHVQGTPSNDSVIQSCVYIHGSGWGLFTICQFLNLDLYQYLVIGNITCNTYCYGCGLGDKHDHVAAGKSLTQSLAYDPEGSNWRSDWALDAS